MSTAWKWLMGGVLWGCTGDVEISTDSAAPSSPSGVRVAFIADTHVIGPQYVCCSESDGIDNDSILKTEDRLRRAVSVINAIEPKVEHVFVLGDVVHDAHHGTDLDWYLDQDTAFSRAANALADLRMPAHLLWGNHDYEVVCGGGERHHPRSFTHQLFEHFFDAPTYSSLDVGDWRFLLLNSQLGPTWDAASERCDTELGSFGEQQLDWLDAQLSERLPSIVMTHHHMITSMAQNENDGIHPDLSTVLGRHDNVVVHLAGHLHRWVELPPTDSHPVRHIVLGSTRYDVDNFWIADFEASGTFEIVDYGKPKWSTTCAETWSYGDGMGPILGAVEEGDCGSF